MPGKRLVVCADGTWTSAYRPDGHRASTNVRHVAQAVLPAGHDGTPQIVFYQSGVETGWARVDRLLGGGMGLTRSVVDAYRFLIDTYEAGDELFLFGFSRGAYTVRSLAGLIRNCGILRKTHVDRLQEAYDRYRDHDSPEWRPRGSEAVLFRQRYAWREPPRQSDDERGKDTTIRFLGVWDTVGALGVPGGLLRRRSKRRHAFHDTQLSRAVDHAYQALAIDERRAPFHPTLWDPGSPRLPGQTLLQTWFAGVHANVGGGYADSGLSDLALDWLATHAMAHGLALDRNVVRRRPNALALQADSQTLGSRVVGLLGKLNPVHRWYARRDVQAREDAAVAYRTSWIGDCVRAIPPGTSIHPSVHERRLGRIDYRPPNVGPAALRALTASNDATGTSAADATPCRARSSPLPR